MDFGFIAVRASLSTPSLGPAAKRLFLILARAALSVCVVRGACLLAALGQCVLRHTTPMSAVYIIYSIYLARFKG